MAILKEGIPFMLPSFFAGAICAAAPSLAAGLPAFPSLPFAVCCALWAAGGLLLAFALFCVFFFRDPRISVNAAAGTILSPCNGTVMEVLETEDERIVRVFLSVFDVHLQRAPVEGRVRSVTHKDGSFLMAWDPQAHLVNEQNEFVIESARGAVKVRQIAGFLARRCVAWVKEGDTVAQAGKIGMIKFSSQVDLHLPRNVRISVKKGDKVRAGITAAGEFV